MLDIFTSKDQTDPKDCISIYVCRPADWDEIRELLSESQKTYALAREFVGEQGQSVSLPDAEGQITHHLYGVGNEKGDVLNAVRLGGLSATLNHGHYKLAYIPEDWDAALCAIGWGLGCYKFNRYLSSENSFPVLSLEEVHRPREASALVKAVHLGRDLINTPAGDMGPDALGKATQELAQQYGADIRATIGEALMTENLPMIHAVGRAAHEAPRLVEFEWGNPAHPRLALIGKGITFDTGGLNIKSASGARIMKKDMGGACLLYTSPSPRDLSTSRMPSSA